MISYNISAFESFVIMEKVNVFSGKEKAQYVNWLNPSGDKRFSRMIDNHVTNRKITLRT